MAESACFLVQCQASVLGLTGLVSRVWVVPSTCDNVGS